MATKRILLTKKNSSRIVVFYEDGRATIQHNSDINVYQVSVEFANMIIDDLMKDGYKAVEF